MPKVSILIPAFRPDYLDTCIASAIAQSFRDIEILIGDDSDGDDVQSVVAKWDDPRIRCGRNPRRQQPGANRDFLLSQAAGKYVKFLFDDDFLLPRSVELLCAGVESTRSALAFHGRYAVDTVGRVLEATSVVPPGGVAPIAPQLFFDQLIGNLFNFIGEPSNVLIDADVLRALPNPFGIGTMRMRFLTDVALYANLAHAGQQMVGIGYFSSAFRRHSSQASTTGSPIYSAGLFEWELLARWSADLGHLPAAACRRLVEELHRRYQTELTGYPELGLLLANGAGPDTAGHFFGPPFCQALEAAWATVEERVADRRRAAAA